MFQQVLSYFQGVYPNAHLEIRSQFGHNILCAYEQEQFCIDGYNDLYCITELCRVLKGELK